MNFEWKHSADEDVFDHALRHAYDVHWQAVNRLQSENEQLRKIVTTTGTPNCVEGISEAKDSNSQKRVSYGTTVEVDDDTERFEVEDCSAKDRQSQKRVSYASSIEVDDGMERFEVEDSFSIGGLSQKRVSCGATVEVDDSTERFEVEDSSQMPKELLALPRGASIPPLTQRNIRRDRLQVLASGGESDLPDSMDDCAQFAQNRTGVPAGSLVGPRITISSLVSLQEDGVDVAVSEPMKNWNSECPFELRAQWVTSPKVAKTISDLRFSRSMSDNRQSSASGIISMASLQRTSNEGRFLGGRPHFSLKDPRCIHPDSSLRSAWDMSSVVLLVYDCVMLPLSFFKFGFGSWIKAVGLLSTIFWTMDILASFGTGVYTNGVLHTSPRVVALHYIKRWLCFDVVVTGLEWFLFFLATDDSDGRSSISGIRILRFFRFLRILRAIKLSLLATKLSRRVNNVTILLVLRLLGHMGLLVMINHATAALWYIIGDIGNSSDGWLSSFESRSPTLLYLSSLHWSITNFHGATDVNPVNERERAFACFVLLLGIVGFSTFVGSITNSISMVQKFHEVRTRKYHLLCKYLLKQNISGALCAKAKRCFDDEMMLNQQEEEIDITSILSGDIVDELHEEARTRHALSNSIFCYFWSNYPRLTKQLCRDAMSEEHARRGHNFFFYGDACERVVIIMTGTARYVHHSDDRDARTSASSAVASLSSFRCDVGDTVNDERWICEMVLWTHWVCCGWLGALSECHILTIDHTVFGQVVKLYEHARFVACQYARKVLDSLQYQPLTDLLEVTVYLNVPNWQATPKFRPRSSLLSLRSSENEG